MAGALAAPDGNGRKREKTDKKMATVFTVAIQSNVVIKSYRTEKRSPIYYHATSRVVLPWEGTESIYRIRLFSIYSRISR